MMMMKY